MKNKAFLVGINKYPLPEDELFGCVNDINDMADYLTSPAIGFKKSNIRMLVDERATKAEIMKRLKWLVEDAKSGDRLVFHFSGHGAQISTRNAKGEVDGLDEVICPYDFDWTNKTAVKDNDFYTIFKALPKGVKMVWISDSCHSGDLIRGLDNNKDRRPRAMNVPADIAWRNASAQEAQIALKNIHVRSAKVPFLSLISGCKSHQTSADADFGGRNNGALTYYLLKILKEKKYEKEPLTNVVAEVTKRLKREKFTQRPQLEGAEQRKIISFLS